MLYFSMYVNTREYDSSWGMDARHASSGYSLSAHIVNDNALPATVRGLLTTSFVVSLEKPEGDGRRPIAIGDMFVRLAARFALHQVQQAARRAMQPHQFGAGQADGCTQIVQSIQHLLSAPCPATDASPPRPLACLRIDIKNAFNAIDRAPVLRAVYSNPELACCWRTVAFGYDQPSMLLMPCGAAVPDDEAVIESQMGVRQGDPLAAMLFSLAMHPVYAEAARMSRGGCYAYIDDSNILGTVEECWRVWTRLPDLLSSLALSVNITKCDLTCFQLDRATADADRTALCAFRQANFTINERSVRLLGCVVGADDSCIAEALRTDPYTSARRESLRSGACPECTGEPHGCCCVISTGRSSLTASAQCHLRRRWRMLPPTMQASWRSPTLSWASRALMATATTLRWHEPLAMGGMGLTSAVTLAPAAYIAGAEVAMRLSPAFASVWSGHEPLSPTCRQHAAIDNCILRILETENANQSSVRRGGVHPCAGASASTP